MTKDDILAASGASDIVAKDGIIALIYPYRPYIKYEDILVLDSYYVASNTAYINTKKAHLGEITNDIDIKTLLIECGLNKCRSSLVLHPKFGSYFLVQTVICNFNISDIHIECEALKCNACNKCISACPGNAITENTFIRDNCLRNMMDSSLTCASAPLLGNDLLGCQICRSVCPYNANIVKEDIPIALKNILKLESILAFDSTTHAILSSYIGKNMARASLLLPQAMAIALRNNRYDLIPLIQQLTQHPSARVCLSAQTTLNLFGTKSN